MYQHIDFSETGGFPLTQDAMAFLQDAYNQVLSSFTGVIGDPAIIQGVVSSGGNVSDGWVCLNGEIVPFVGAPVSQGANVDIQETVASVTYRDSGLKGVIITRKAVLGSTGTPLANFTQIDLPSLKAGIDAANAASAAALTAANNALTAANNALTVANNALTVANNANTTANNALAGGGTTSTQLATLTTNFNNFKNSTKIYSNGYMKFGRGSNASGVLFPPNVDINPYQYFGSGAQPITIGPFPVNVNVFVIFNMLVRTNDSGGQEYIYMRIMNTNNTVVLTEGYFRALVQNSNNGNSPDPDIATLTANFTMPANTTQLVNVFVNNYANQVNTPQYHGSELNVIVIPV